MILERVALIDRVSSVSDERDAITCEATLPLESPVFDGHFPGFATMPGVLMIEMMAQAAGYLILARNRVTAMPILAGVDSARFRSLARPGQALTAQAKLVHDGSGYAVLDTTLRHEGQRFAEAQIRLRITPFFSEEMRGHVIAMIATHKELDAPAGPVLAGAA